MKADQLFHDLKLLAEQMGIKVSEQNFRKTGIAVKSGYCKVKGEEMFLIDKHLKSSKKLEILAEYLGQLPLDRLASLEIHPHLKDCLDHFGFGVSAPSEHSDAFIESGGTSDGHSGE